MAPAAYSAAAAAPGISAITDVSSDRLVPPRPARGPPPRPPGPGEFVDSQGTRRSRSRRDEEKKPKSLADKRGRNWSLPSSAKIERAGLADNSTRMPRRSNCHPSGSGQCGARSDPPRPANRRLDRSARVGVWAHTKGWGIAGRQMYWRPVLELHLGPSGEGRCGEVQALMANSGLEVIRK